MTDAPEQTLLERYERTRQQCLKWANLHPDSPEACWQALNYCRGPALMPSDVAMLLDDMAIALRRLTRSTVLR